MLGSQAASYSPIQSQVIAKEFKRALPGQAGRVGFKVLALVAIEAVACVVDE